MTFDRKFLLILGGLSAIAVIVIAVAASSSYYYTGRIMISEYVAIIYSEDGVCITEHASDGLSKRIMDCFAEVGDVAYIIHERGQSRAVLGSYIADVATLDAGGNMTTEPDNAPVELAITTHNPVCTAVFLHHIGVARITDVRPLPAMPHYYGADAYTIDELVNGTSVSALVWQHQMNETMRTILEQPEVISVAAYPYAAPNSTHPGRPEPLALAVDPPAGVISDPTDPLYLCHAMPSHFNLGLIMESIGWAGVSDPVPAPESALARGASGASEPTAVPLTLDREPGFDAQPDPRNKILYYNNLMRVEIRTYNVTDTWAYLKANGALVVGVLGVDEPFGIVAAYIPPPLMWSVSVEENTFSVRPVTRGAFGE